MVEHTERGDFATPIYLHNIYARRGAGAGFNNSKGINTRFVYGTGFLTLAWPLVATRRGGVPSPVFVVLIPRYASKRASFSRLF